MNADCLELTKKAKARHSAAETTSASKEVLVKEDQLDEWVEKWMALYPDPETEDLFLQRFRGNSSFGYAEVESLIHWKYPKQDRTPLAQFRLDRILELFGKNEDAEIRRITGLAFQELDDRKALRLVEKLSGIGNAMGSTVLMAQNPDRFTVYDVRAWNSLEKLGLVSHWWTTYLKACRQISSATGYSLREVDRALYAANGNPELPSRGGKAPG